MLRIRFCGVSQFSRQFKFPPIQIPASSFSRQAISRQFKIPPGKIPPVHFPARQFPASSKSRQAKSRQFIFPPGYFPPGIFPPNLTLNSFRSLFQPEISFEKFLFFRILLNKRHKHKHYITHRKWYGIKFNVMLSIFITW